MEADAEVLERVHAEDIELFKPYGKVHSRAEYLSQILSGQLNYTVWEPGEISVRAYSNAAVVRYEDEDFEAEFEGDVGSRGGLYHTNLYEKREGQWQIVWSHASGGE